MRLYFIIVFIFVMILDFIVYFNNGSLILMIITSVIASLNLLCALFYNYITKIYEEADNIDSNE